MPCCGRSIAAGAILLAALTFTGIRPAGAQEQPPDLQMLLNLDLFSSQGAADSEAPAPGGSMLDQIQALRQMGYLQANPQDLRIGPEGSWGGDQVVPSWSGDQLVPWIFDLFGEGR